jgi:hypothetical protein
MIYLHKILPIFVLPIMLVIIGILIGLIKNKKKLIYIAIGVLYIISSSIFSNTFFKVVESSEYRKPISALDSADAIVVLSGMLEINEIGDSTYVEWGDPDRFFGGIALFKAGNSKNYIYLVQTKFYKQKSRKLDLSLNFVLSKSAFMIVI